MGLDVYLYRYEDYDAITALEADYEKKSEALWEKEGKYEGISDSRKEEIREEAAKMAKEMGFEKADFGHQHPGKKGIELDSELYPDHMFKIGYLRSSYNGGGINSVLSKTTGSGLSDIFGRNREDYHFQPDWQATIERGREALKKFKEYLDRTAGYSVMSSEFNPLKDELPKSEQEAMSIFLEEQERHKNVPFDDLWSGNYSNAHGEFFLGIPREVAALIPGKKPFLRSDMPCVYAVCKTENNFEWYIQAMEICIEMCEWVLAQPDSEKYYLHWSG